MTPRDQATAAVLGAVFLSEKALDVLIEERVRPAHFHRAHHAAIYTAMLHLRDTGQPVDALTVKARLAGPSSPVTEADIDTLAGTVPDVGNLRGYCQIVRDEAWYAAARDAVFTAQERLEQRDRDGALAAIDLIQSDDPRALVKPDTAEEFMAWYARERQGIKLPFAQLTEATGGFEAGETTMLGGWPAMGKTIVAQQCLLSAQAAGAAVHEYANEMNGPRRTARLISAVTGIAPGKIAKRALTKPEWDETLRVLHRLPYESTPTAGWLVEDYCRMIRRRKDDLAVLDTVTNLPCSKVDEWDRACAMLNDAAAQSGTHLILICQLNLGRDTGALRPVPTGRDLRSTGAWYQRARIVMFVHRDQELVGDGLSQVPRVQPQGHIRVDKATHGEPEAGYVDVVFNPRWMRFDALSDYRMPPEEIAA